MNKKNKTICSSLICTCAFKTPQTFSRTCSHSDDSLIKSVNGSITGQPPGCQPGCGELSFGGLQLSLSVLTRFVPVPVQSTALQIAQIGLLKDTRSSVCTIFDALSSERLFFSGRSHFSGTSGFDKISTVQKFLVKKTLRVSASQACEHKSFSQSAWLLLWTHAALCLATC